MGIIEGIFNIVAPHECLMCNTEGGLLCQTCVSQIRRVPERCYICKRWSKDFLTCQTCRRRSPLYSVQTVAGYEGAAKELLHALKFARAKAAAQVMAKAIAGLEAGVGEVVVTHVPTSQSRVRERGYDQAALIAKELSKLNNLPYLPLLSRLGNKHQVGQRREVRKEQMVGEFRIVKSLDLRNKHVLLVDDVLTTGATCEEAARTLRRAGVKRVSAAVFAVA